MFGCRLGWSLSDGRRIRQLSWSYFTGSCPEFRSTHFHLLSCGSEDDMIEAVKNSRRSFAERLVKGPAGFRRRLERLGPTFIKLGQLLALRPDLIPQEYCDELMHLMDQVPPYSWQEAS